LPDEILQEITILASLSHPHLVNLIEIIDSDNSNFLYLVMEYMQVRWERRKAVCLSPCLSVTWFRDVHYSEYDDAFCIYAPYDYDHTTAGTGDGASSRRRERLHMQADRGSDAGGNGQQNVPVCATPRHLTRTNHALASQNTPYNHSPRRDIIDVLAYLHVNHIAHRDVKPENLLLDITGNIKVSKYEYQCCLVSG
jgi:serine/threonine protein kinase